MKQSDSNAGERNGKRHGRLFGVVRDTLLTGVVALASANAVGAENGEWTVLLDPMYMDAFGHDQQVLTIREIDLGTTPTVDTGMPVALDN